MTEIRKRIGDYEELLEGCRAFYEHEPRDAMYKVARVIVERFWGDTDMITNGLGVLLLTWNQAFYRYGSFDFNRLEECIKKWWTQIEKYRNRTIWSFAKEDENTVKNLFSDFLLASARQKKYAESPVSVAKILHVFAPEFFPLWDDEISKVYGCYWHLPRFSPEKYVEFIWKIREDADRVISSFMQKHNVDRSKAEESIINSHPDQKYRRGILKMIDEYNYSKYTKKWI